MDVLEVISTPRSYSSADARTIESEQLGNELLLEKYNRLLESHHKLLRVNQNLEDKLIKVVTTCEEQKTKMKEELDSLRERLSAQESRTRQLESENVKYRDDCLLAIQLLQCNPSAFLDRKYHDLPPPVQELLSPRRPLRNENGPGRESDERTSTQYEEGSSSFESEIQIFPSFFPPTAVMVPKTNRKNFSGENRPPEGSEVHVTAESVAKVIGSKFQQESCNLFQTNCDIRARPSIQTFNTSNVGRIFDV
ncbi:hypothetical protein RvY_09484 [Ramazzottius varieornatus]|uniref:Uncharacterized protein n=1 Tax=Ramazzottius varieornatus TaxID=947166 RepID=A0A1D1VHE5_RAMVA|nr:hypothetical protein RvY_09484 [Ramazzottius varieornatus]